MNERDSDELEEYLRSTAGLFPQPVPTGRGCKKVTVKTRSNAACPVCGTTATSVTACEQQLRVQLNSL